MKSILIAFIFLPLCAVCQQTRKDSLWSPFKSFIGQWKGMGEGEPGKGAYERSFEFILNSNFLEIRNKATYPPSPHNKNMGEVHEDIGYLSYDGSRKIFILRQFHKEGFVNQYRLDSISPDKKTLVFITEAIENIPPGWKAKETWQVSGENTFSESFELAESGKEFNVYTRVKFSK